MRNTGLEQLALVNPDPGLDPVELRKMAMRSLPVYEQRLEVATLEEAVGDCGAVAMTSGVDGFYRDHSTTPREVAGTLLEIAAEKPVAVVFGPEDKGLGLEELQQATHLIRIPSHPDYPSLNLSQAVLLCCHELYLASGEYRAPQEQTPPAHHRALERMYACWRESLHDIGFCPEEKMDHMMRGVRRILSRGTLSENDVKILMGIARQASWAARNAPAGPSPSRDAED
jgi:tRNA/rRNA methyltransferase